MLNGGYLQALDIEFKSVTNDHLGMYTCVLSRFLVILYAKLLVLVWIFVSL